MGAEKLVNGVPADVEIVIDVIGGDFVIEGKTSGEIRAKGDNPRLEFNGKQVMISCGGDCKLYAPENAALSMGTVGGDCKIAGLTGAIKIGSVGGDLVMRELDSVDVGHVGGDLVAKHIAGQIQVGMVGGDTRFRDVGGNLRADKLSGDTLLEDVRGNCMLSYVGGDLVFALDFAPGMNYHLNAAGDVLGKIAPDANVEFAIPSQTELEVEVPDAQIRDQGEQTLITFGDGQARVSFETIGGEMQLVRAGEHDDEFVIEAPDDIEEIINARISEHIAHLQDKIARKTEKIHERVREATARVEQEAEKIARAQRRGFDFSWSWPEKAKRGEDKAKNSEPIRNKERLEILRMVESKQITVEEAEMLLSALEGSD